MSYLTEEGESQEKMKSELEQKEILQQKHYYLLNELQNMARELPQKYQQRLPYELLSSLANALLDGTVFAIVQDLREIQYITERQLFEKRMKMCNLNKAMRQEMLKKQKELLTTEGQINLPNIPVLQARLEKEKESASIGSGLVEALKYISPSSLFSFKPITRIDTKDLRTLQQLGLIYFLYLLIYSGLEYSLTFLTHLRFNYSSMQQGKLFLFSGVIMMIIQGGYVRRISPGKESKTALMALLSIIPSFILIGISQSQLVLYSGLGIYSFASAAFVPCITTMVSSYGSADQKGTVLGIFRALGALARAVGPLIASAAFWLVGPTLCYCSGAFLLLLPYFLMRRMCCYTIEQEKSKFN